ncbi:acyl-CoA dehydrogenase family protein [Actinocorallia longicatena]|uniref:Acyl-[acyl-carrier-protein] dehydrogenase MbtN n=1 Tax=Actinocorallia longicatena TaxID=111803 RepID=A0ABP6QKS4_9ACTN
MPATPGPAAEPPWSSGPDLRLLRATARKFLETEAVPHRERWEEQRHIDRDFWRKAGDLGLLCCAVPEQYGGGGGTIAHDLVVIEEQARALELGWGNTVQSGIVAHYLLAYGTEQQKNRCLPALASGEAVAAIAMTEPGAGSDLKALTTQAVRDGDDYLVTGTKTFISNGGSADLVVLAAKTDPDAGAKGVTLLIADVRDGQGFHRGRTLRKLGQHTSDTAELHFDQMRLPAGAVLGEVGRGFAHMMEQLPQERLCIATIAVASIERAVELAVEYSRQRRAFGGTLFDLQNTRFELAECATLARAGRVFLDDCVARHLDGALDTATASMAKWWLTDLQCQIVDRCQQLFGGYGYMWDYPITRMAADARVQRVYGGANELMKELIARSL